MSELKPCPFCGGKIKTAAITFDEKFYEPPYEAWYLEHADIVAAFEEHCPIPTTDTFYDTEAEAVEAWNTRVETTFVTGITTVTDTPQITYVPERTCERKLEYNGWHCSACGYLIICSGADDDATDLDPKYCPNCGAKVVNDEANQ